jgi:hypothetical protein
MPRALISRRVRRSRLFRKQTLRESRTESTPGCLAQSVAACGHRCRTPMHTQVLRASPRAEWREPESWGFPAWVPPRRLERGSAMLLRQRRSAGRVRCKSSMRPGVRRRSSPHARRHSSRSVRRFCGGKVPTAPWRQRVRELVPDAAFGRLASYERSVRYCARWDSAKRLSRPSNPDGGAPSPWIRRTPTGRRCVVAIRSKSAASGEF